MNAAFTGHLVFSTLHTNDAPSGFTRLIDQGIKPFLVASAVRAILAQRLVRKICQHCKVAYTPSQEVLDSLGIPPGDYTFYKKQGCSVCDGKGYKGRMGIYEVMFMDEEIRELTASAKDIRSIQSVAIKHGMKTLRQAAIDRVIEGVTSVEEALRATADQ